jgi:hypothetical protein
LRLEKIAPVSKHAIAVGCSSRSGS